MLRFLTIWNLKYFLWGHSFSLVINTLLFLQWYGGIDFWLLRILYPWRQRIVNYFIFSFPKELFDFRYIFPFYPLSKSVFPSFKPLWESRDGVSPLSVSPTPCLLWPLFPPALVQFLPLSVLTLSWMIVFSANVYSPRFRHLKFIILVSVQQVISCVKEQYVLSSQYL